ncbi:DoxX family protein [Planctomycetota bacterium]
MASSLNVRNVDLGPLVIRIALAVVFIYHGYPKIFAGGHADIAQLMLDQGAPKPELLGWVAGSAEFFGGILIFIGLLSRLWALGLVGVMSVAIYTVHWANGFDLQNEGFGYEYCLVLLLAALAILLGGPGRISLDRCIIAKIKPEKPKKTESEPEKAVNIFK